MIRLAVPEDFTSIMSIYAYARSFMQETGNPNQWGNHFPPEELIHNRIRDKQLLSWKKTARCTARLPSSSVRSDVSADRRRLLALRCAVWHDPPGCLRRNNPRIFLPDRRLLLGTDPAPARRYACGQSNHAASDPENGFERRGIIYVLNHSPRIAFERVK